MTFTVYLAGEIHADWREEIRRGAESAELDVVFTSPVTDHPASDAAGDHLRRTEQPFWRAPQSAQANAIRTPPLIEQADLVALRLGDQHNPWYAAITADSHTT